MRHVGTGQEHVVAADAGDALVVRSAAVDGAALTEHVAIANLETGRLAPVFLVLGCIANRGELEDDVVGAHRGRAIDDCMRGDARARPEPHQRTDDGEGPDADIRGELRLGRDDGAPIDHDASPFPGPPGWIDDGARRQHQLGSEAASASPTDATADIFQMPRRVRSSVALRVSWSPGSTGRRKRALSMPTK